MSTKNTFFAVEREVPLAKILKAARAAVTDLDNPSRVCAWVQRRSEATALRWFSLCASRPSRYEVSALLERVYDEVPHLIVARHDDQSGVFAFQRLARRPGKKGLQADLVLLSDGGRLGVVHGALPHPERVAKPGEGNAIEVGLSQYYPGEGRAYLGAYDHSKFFVVHPRPAKGKSSRIAREEARSMRSFADFLPEDYWWREAKIPPRIY